MEGLIRFRHQIAPYISLFLLQVYKKHCGEPFFSSMEDVTADNEEVNTAKNVPEGEPRLEEDAVQEIITEVFVMDPAKNGNKPQVPPTCSSTLHKVNCKSSSLSTMEAQKATSQSDDAPNSSSLTAAPPVASEGTSTVTSLVESSQKVQSSLVIPNTGRPIPVLLCKSDSTSGKRFF